MLLAPEPDLETLSVIEELRTLGHRLAFSQADSGEDSAVWIGGDLAVWVHGEVTPDGRVQRLDRVEILWRRM